MMCEEVVIIYFLLGSCLLLQLVVLGAVVWATVLYIRARSWINYITEPADRKMDDALDELLEPTPAGVAQDVSQQTETTSQQHRERLAAIASGGQAKKYLGKALTAEQIDALGEDEVEKLYARYEARLGAAMTKTLGQAALELYTCVASLVLPIPPENRQPLMEDLGADPFVGHALNGAACELYHRYGMYLAPLTAGLTTAKYVRFGHRCPRRDTSDDGEPADGEQCVTSTSSAESDWDRNGSNN